MKWKAVFSGLIVVKWLQVSKSHSWWSWSSTGPDGCWFGAFITSPWRYFHTHFDPISLILSRITFFSPFHLYSWVWLGWLGFSNWALWIVMFNMLQTAVLAQRANHMELVVSIRRCHSGWEPTQLHWHLCWRPFSSRCLAWELLHYELSWSDSVAMPVKVCQSVKRTLLLSGPHLFTSVVCYSMSFLLIVCASPSPSPPSLFSMFFPLLCCAVVSF
jgi:hypothetical protein